jgi:hypothetical protein
MFLLPPLRRGDSRSQAMFPYHPYSTEQSEDSTVLIRELATHVWARLRAGFGQVGQWLDRLTPADRDPFIRFPLF